MTAISRSTRRPPPIDFPTWSFHPMRPAKCLKAWLIGILLAFPMPGRAADGPQEAEGRAPRQVYNSQTEDIPRVDAATVARTMRMPEGFQATVFATEPDVRQPIAMAFDTRGRLFVAENYTYAESSLDTERDLYDRILIFSDEDQDGRAERRLVFWDKAQQLTSVAVGFGGVWALCPPNLVFLPDRDRDDRPDGPPEVVLNGFASEGIRHNFANGLAWGPDGWLYGRHGILNVSLVGRPDQPDSQRTRVNCGIWRYHPTRRVFEMVCDGTTNPWGADWDDYGEMFFINTVIGHLWHALPGAHYRRMYGHDADPSVYHLIDQTADHYHWDTAEAWNEQRTIGLTESSSRAGGGHAHTGLMIYLGDNWPDSYRGELFTLNFNGRRINHDHLQRAGATYRGLHRPDLLFIDDPWFRGIDLAYGPDGGVYILDWSDIGECHDDDGVHRTSGRIYKVTYGTPERRPMEDLAERTDRELVGLLAHRNRWFARQAALVLQERAAGGRDLSDSAAALQEIVHGPGDVPLRLRALWCLYRIGQADGDWLISRLEEENEHLRAWAVRLLVESPWEEASGTALVRLSRRESSGLVLTYLASALQRLPVEVRWEVAEGLVGHGEFRDDPVLPLMIWYGLRDAVPRMPRAAVRLAGTSQIGLVTRLIARRLAEDLPRYRQALGELVGELPGAPADHQRAVLAGMQTALRGWRRADPPPGWGAVARQLEQGHDQEITQLVDRLSAIFGDGQAITLIRKTAADRHEDLQVRRAALQTLVESRAEGTEDLVRQLLDDPDLAPDAIASLAVLPITDRPDLLLPRLHAWDTAARQAAIQVLVARAADARALLDAIERGEAERQWVSPLDLRRLQLLRDNVVDQQIGRLWADLPDISQGTLERFDHYRALLSPARLQSANAEKGRQLFEQTCAKCHRPDNQGRTIGPELSGAQRGNLNYWLDNIIEPSASVAADYRVASLLLNDGRVVQGVVVQQSPRTLTVQTTDQALVLERDSVDERIDSDRSLMPEGLLDVMSDQDVCNLIAFLMGPPQEQQTSHESARTD